MNIHFLSTNRGMNLFDAYDYINDVYKLQFQKTVISHIILINSKDIEKLKKFGIRLSKISFNEEDIKHGVVYES